jgi:hypothetical protein
MVRKMIRVVAIIIFFLGFSLYTIPPEASAINCTYEVTCYCKCWSDGNSKYVISFKKNISVSGYLYWARCRPDSDAKVKSACAQKIGSSCMETCNTYNDGCTYYIIKNSWKDQGVTYDCD